MEARRILHTGRVVGRDGRPAAGAFVWVASGTAPTPEVAIVCDEKGHFRIALPAGYFEIKARTAEGLEGHTETIVGNEPLHIEVGVGNG